MSKAKQSYKNKYNNWCSKQQSDYILNSTKKLSKMVRLHKLKDEIKIYKHVRPTIFHISDTLDMFDYHAKENGYEYNFLQDIKKNLHSVVEYDLVFGLKGKTYLYHTYKILGFIQESILAYNCSNEPEFLKGTIGASPSNRTYFRSEYKTHLEIANDKMTLDQGSHNLSSYIFGNLYLRPHLSKQFFAYFALYGVENIKMPEDSTYENRLIKRACKIYMSGHVSEDDCADSLVSVLYFYMLFHMRMSKKLALEVAKNLVYDVFGIYKKYTGSEILKNLHVKEVIGSHIVYGFSTKTIFLKDSQKDYLENVIINNMDSMSLDKAMFPQQTIKDSVNNPLKTYMLLTPSELLQEIC
jgi:hypothetical protein